VSDCGPCLYGIDTPSRSELIAATHTPKEFAAYVTSDSLSHLSPEGLYAALSGGAKGCCDACFSGNYPVGMRARAARRNEKRGLPIIGI
jgi:amidophosphoribosyltransferase